jgi:threonine dehydrogenase-like Zn-dependent dehydrogenase
VRALRLIEARHLEIVEIPDPVAGPGEVVVRISSTGICGSDLSCYKWGIFAGSVLGHELAGVITEVGDGVEGWEPGDPVAVDPKTPCGECADCHSGSGYRCPAALTGGIGAAKPGGFAALVAAAATQLHRLPPSVAPEDACLVEPLSVAIHGVARGGNAKDAEGADAVVVGLGPIGLLAIAALRDAGARRIVGIDPVETRRALAATIGADQTYAPGAEAREAASGSHLAVEASGRSEVLQETTDLVAPGGRVVLLGVPMKGATVVPLSWVTREITITGSIASTPEEFEAAIDLLARRREIAQIITRRVGLEDLPAAFEAMLSPAADGKIAFSPDA